MWPAFSSAGANAPDAAVHHVGGRDDVDAGRGLRERLLDEHLQRHVVDDVAGLVDDAVLAVRGVGIERDVGHDAEFGKALLQRAHRARHETFRVVGFAPVEAFQALVDDREQRQHRHAVA